MRSRQPAIAAFLASFAAATLSFAALAGSGGIAAHWTFDQTGQGTALDSVGGMHGTGVVNVGQVLPLLGTQPD